MSFISVLLISLLTGCSSSQRPYWGEQATFTPGWHRLKVAAKEATIHPGTWMPLAGAVVFQGADWDRLVSDWASEETPLFGSNQNAEEWSDRLLAGSRYVDYLSLIAVDGPSGTDWFVAKGKGGLVHMLAGNVTHESTSFLKEEARRERPNGLNRRSFPSGHTSMSTTHYILAADTLQYSTLNRPSKRVFGHSLSALGGLTGWARVEARVHYPSDVFAGYALGNWVAQFSIRAFLSDESRLLPLIGQNGAGTTVGFVWQY